MVVTQREIEKRAMNKMIADEKVNEIKKLACQFWSDSGKKGRPDNFLSDALKFLKATEKTEELLDA